MSNWFWILFLAIALFFSIMCGVIIFFYFHFSNKLKNDLVVRIHMLDYTVNHYRFSEIPTNNIISIEEKDNKGKSIFKTYNVREDCIEKGTWGRYIDFDYNISEPINPHARGYESFVRRFLEMFKLIGAFLDTDLHVKMMRSSEFENFVRLFLIMILIISGLCFIGIVAGDIKVFTMKQSSNNCILTLDNQTWQTIYIASHNPIPTMQGIKK